MSIRTIRYTVTAAGISPATVQKGGLQGEHRATELVFSFNENFRNQLKDMREPDGIEDFYYRFEAHTGGGAKGITDEQILYVRQFANEANPLTVTYPLENWLTRDGGTIRVYLVISYVNTENKETLMDLYTYPALLRLDAVPDAEFTDGENYESLTTLSIVAKDSAARAEAAANNAKGSAEAAAVSKQLTEEAQRALENGSEIVMLGGDASGGSVAVELVVDEELSSVSTNTVQNRVIAAAIDEAKKELKSYTDNEIATFDFIKIVDSLGDTGLPNRLYLVPKNDAEGNDLFDEYIWANDKWEFITTKQIEIDLTPYVKREEQIDYIVEQGISGIWTYRKWNSGLAECWGMATVSVLCDEARSFVYADAVKRIALPENLFITAPTVVNINPMAETGWNFLSAHIHSVDSTTLSYIPASASQMETAINVRININARGKWK